MSELIFLQQQKIVADSELSKSYVEYELKLWKYSNRNLILGCTGSLRYSIDTSLNRNPNSFLSIDFMRFILFRDEEPY